MQSSSSLVTTLKNLLRSPYFATLEHTIVGIVLWSLVRRIRRCGLKSVLNDLISGFLASTANLTQSLIANTMKADAAKAVAEMFPDEGVASDDATMRCGWLGLGLFVFFQRVLFYLLLCYAVGFFV
jgi:hypothetical protein